MAYTNLTFLSESVGNDKELIKEMIGLFINQVPEFISNLKKHLREKNYLELGKESHKAKSSVMIMGMEELGMEMKHLQLATIDGVEVEKYAYYVNKFEAELLAAVEELNETLKQY